MPWDYLRLEISLQVPYKQVNEYGSLQTPTSYGLEGPGNESWWGGEILPAPVQNSPGAHPASCTIGTGSLSEG